MKWKIESRTRISYKKRCKYLYINIYYIIICKKLFSPSFWRWNMFSLLPFFFPCLLALFLTSLFVHFALFYFFLPISNSRFLFFVYFLLSLFSFNTFQTLFKRFSHTRCTRCFHPSDSHRSLFIDTTNKK